MVSLFVLSIPGDEVHLTQKLADVTELYDV
jgi:hypothetical protein